MKKLGFLLIACTLIASISKSYADDHLGIYAGLGAGLSFGNLNTYASDVTNNINHKNAVKLTHNINMIVGYNIMPYLDVEAEYAYSFTQNLDINPDVAGDGKRDFSSHLFFANVIGKYEIIENSTVFIKAGLGYALYKNTGSVITSSTKTDGGTSSGNTGGTSSGNTGGGTNSGNTGGGTNSGNTGGGTSSGNTGGGTNSGNTGGGTSSPNDDATSTEETPGRSTNQSTTTNFDYNLTGFTFQVGLGYEFAFDANNSLSIAYMFKMTPSLSVSDAKNDTDQAKVNAFKKEYQNSLSKAGASSIQIAYKFTF